MKDKEILKDIIMVIPVSILLVVIMFMLYSNNNLNKINEELKKENFEYKQQIKKLQEKELERLIKGE
jgi:K+ transporter